MQHMKKSMIWLCSLQLNCIAVINLSINGLINVGISHEVNRPEMQTTKPSAVITYCPTLHSHTAYTTNPVYSSHLIEGEGAHTVGGQFHSVQHGHLNHPICLCASTRPILVTLHLHTNTQVVLVVKIVLLLYTERIKLSGREKYWEEWNRYYSKFDSSSDHPSVYWTSIH